LEKKALAAEEEDCEHFDNVKCPEEGFHGEKERRQDDDDEHNLGDGDDKQQETPERVKFLREAIKHCRHFISMVACPQWQLIAMEIVAKAILGLKMEKCVGEIIIHENVF
jgi:Fe-S-cluster-containing dehydrogenase component